MPDILNNAVEKRIEKCGPLLLLVHDVKREPTSQVLNDRSADQQRGLCAQCGSQRASEHETSRLAFILVPVDIQPCFKMDNNGKRLASNAGRPATSLNAETTAVRVTESTIDIEPAPLPLPEPATAYKVALPPKPATNPSAAAAAAAMPEDQVDFSSSFDDQYKKEEEYRPINRDHVAPPRSSSSLDAGKHAWYSQKSSVIMVVFLIAIFLIGSTVFIMQMFTPSPWKIILYIGVFVVISFVLILLDVKSTRFRQV